jgi:hypothetical protein
MKSLSLLLIAIATIFLSSCEGSDTYRGSWNALNAEGKKCNISFDAKNFSVKDSGGVSKDYQYSQNSVSIKNASKTYRIEISDGRNYLIRFPKADRDSIGLILDENGGLLFTISRNDYVTYDDIYKLD